MISIKDYAKETGVSYEAVRQRVKRYEADLEGHIHRQGRVQFLDDVAVAFLNEHRLQNPTVIYDRAAGEEFRELKAELAEAKALATDYWEQLKAKDNMMMHLIEENKALRLQAASVARLEADNESARLEAQKAQDELRAAQKAAEEARAAEEAKYIQELAVVQQQAQDELTAAQEKAAAELAERDKQIQELENRTFGDYLKGWFRKKKE